MNSKQQNKNEKDGRSMRAGGYPSCLLGNQISSYLDEAIVGWPS